MVAVSELINQTEGSVRVGLPQVNLKENKQQQ